jgi:hypothetical protein
LGFLASGPPGLVSIFGGPGERIGLARLPAPIANQAVSRLANN